MLYIIRHGRTDWNDEEKLQGRTDIPLNEEGRKMAREAAKEYKDINFDIAFCSPLSRAKETADILLEGRNIPVIYDDRLAEMSFGVCEGMKYYFANNDSPVSRFFNDPEHYDDPPEGAESMDELFERTGEFLKEKVKPELDAGKDVLIVGHGAMNSSIICQVKNMPRKDYWSAGLENCKLKRLL